MVQFPIESGQICFLFSFQLHQPLGHRSKLDLDMWTRGGGVLEPCGPNGHVDLEREDDEIGLVMCRRE